MNAFRYILFQNDFIRLFLIKPNSGKVIIKIAGNSSEYTAAMKAQIVVHSLQETTNEEKQLLQTQLQKIIQDNHAFDMIWLD